LVNEEVRKAEAKRQKELADFLAKQERNIKKAAALLKKDGLEWVSKRLTCKGNHQQGERQPKWKNQPTWNWCEPCDYFGICEVCSGSQMELIDAHDLVCGEISERFADFLLVV
jgi:uncharacterized GH25 family protein